MSIQSVIADFYGGGATRSPGRGGVGTVVSILAFNSDDSGSIPGEE